MRFLLPQSRTAQGILRRIVPGSASSPVVHRSTIRVHRTGRSSPQSTDVCPQAPCTLDADVATTGRNHARDHPPKGPPGFRRARRRPGARLVYGYRAITRRSDRRLRGPRHRPEAPRRSAPPTRQPNIVLIVADDIGYTDLGCFGGEIPTPNLDRLAYGGRRFTQMLTNPMCCPSRASLLTGLYPTQAGVGYYTSDYGSPGYVGHLNDQLRDDGPGPEGGGLPDRDRRQVARVRLAHTAGRAAGSRLRPVVLRDRWQRLLHHRALPRTAETSASRRTRTST